MVIAVVAAMLITAALFALYGANPLQAYFALFHEPFASLRGFGYTLVRAAPLMLIALGTIVSWRGCGDHLAGSIHFVFRLGVFTFGAFVEFCHWSRVGGSGCPDAGSAGGQRSAHLADDQLRRDPDRAVPCIRPYACSRRCA
jgi:hypothetical protein